MGGRKGAAAGLGVDRPAGLGGGAGAGRRAVMDGVVVGASVVGIGGLLLVLLLALRKPPDDGGED